MRERRYLADRSLQTCSRCYRVLPYASFGKRRSRSNGLRAQCKECVRAARERKRLGLPYKWRVLELRTEGQKRQTKAWLRFSRALLEARGHRCEDCGKAVGNGVAWGCHSLIYNHDGRDPGDYLILCAPCHGKRHGG